MKDILKLEKCPISGLSIITKPEWRYENRDSSLLVEIGKIGKSIIFISVVGSALNDTNESIYTILNRIIDEHPSNIPLYLIFDYTKLTKESIRTKKSFVNWVLSVLDKVQKIVFLGVTNTLKLTINTTKIISSKFYKIAIYDTYQDAIKFVMKEENGYLNKKVMKHPHINELIGYLGKMTWTGNLDQEIPILPDDDPFAELFAAVAASQEDLREIDNDRRQTNKKLKQLILEKDKALKSLSDKELVMRSMLDDMQVQETKTKKVIEQLETIIKGANLGWWDWDIPSGNEIFNDILTENLGYKLNEITPHINWWKNKIHPNDEKQISEDLQNHFDRKTEYYENKHRLKTKSGEWKWFLDYGKVIERDKDGKAIRMIGILRDIDKEERAEQNLKQSEEYYRTLIENNNDVITVIDKRGKIISISNSSRILFGYTIEERKRKNAFALMLSDDRKRMMQVLKEITENEEKHGSITNIDFRVYQKDGSIRYIEGTAKNMLHSPVVKGIVINYRDVTERIINEKELRSREAYLEALNKISEISFITGSDTELQSFVEIIGEVANASRTYIFKNHKNINNELLLSHVAEYVAEGIKPEIDNPELQNLNYNDWLPRWKKILERGEIINGKITDFPETERFLLEPQDIISLVVIPIFVDNIYWGFLGFDNCMIMTLNI